MGKWGKNIFFGLLILVVLLVLAIWTAGIVMRGMTQREIKRIAAAGEPVTFEDLAPQEIYPLQNAAEMYEPALQKMPKVNLPSENWDAYLRRNPKTSAQLLKQCRPVFDLLAAGFARPQCRYDLDYRMGYRMKPPDLLQARRIALLCALKASDDLARGRDFAAQETLAQGLRFVNTLQPEASLLTLMIQTACRRSLGSAIEQAIARKVKPDRNLLNQIRLVGDRGNQEIVQAFCGERAMGLSFFKELGESPVAKRNRELKSLNRELNMTDTSRRWSWIVLLEPLFYYDQWYFLRYWSQSIAQVEQGMDLSPKNEPPAFCLLSRLLIPNLNRALPKVRETILQYRRLAGQMNRLDSHGAADR